MLDKYAQKIIDDNANMMVPWYLIAAYAYYVQDEPVVSDRFYDQLAEDLLLNYRFVEHVHRHHITEEMLKAGTYLGDYPSIIEGAVQHLREHMEEYT
jgi:hypothetical protein